MRKIAIICILLMCILCVGCGSKDNVAGNSYNEKVKGNNGEEVQSIVTDNLNENIQYVTIDDYAIVLEKATFDNVNYEAYCEFTVTKDNGKEKVYFEDRNNEELDNNHFGDNNRFSFLQDIKTGAIESNMTFEEEGNILHIKYTLSIDSDYFDGKIYLYDAESNLEESIDNCTDFFELTDIVDSKKYVSKENDISIYVSEMSVRISSKTELDEDTLDLTFIYNNGEEKKIVAQGKMSDEIKGYTTGYFDNTGVYHYKFTFSNIEEIKNIKSISLNEAEYE